MRPPLSRNLGITPTFNVRRIMFDLVLLCVALPLLVTGSSAGQPPSSSEPLSLTDLAGGRIDPFTATATNGVVFLFVRPDCPISNRYAPEIRRLHEMCSNAGISFWLVYADADISAEDIRRHAAEYELRCPVLRDTNQALARMARVRVTPEAAVFQGPRLMYHGRIDDRYAALGVDRGTPTRHDLQDVIQAIIRWEPVTVVSAPAVGCSIFSPK